jgi:hypothetical protein
MTPAQPKLAVHYESDISVEQDSQTRAMRVTKRYRTTHPCVAWLNERLGDWYDRDRGLPVAQHEWAAYQLLEPYGIVPRPIDCLPDAIVVEWGGEPLAPDAAIADDDYRAQAEHVLKVFAATGFSHNDLLERNVLVSDGALRIIDFTLAEFGQVSLMGDLPNPAWARPGEDAMLLDHLHRLRAAAPASRRLRHMLRRTTWRLPWTAS